MPKGTFFKIAEEKREKLLSEGARLFAERGFNQTDMAELASRAGIAKGSIYNYFESKEDLYLYICRDGIERSRNAIYSDMNPAWDVYRQIEHIFQQGARFVQAHPEYLVLYANVSSAGMERFSDQMSLEVEKFTADYLKRLIHRDMLRGLIRDDVDVNYAAFLINSLYIIFMTSLVSSHFKIRMCEYLEISEELTRDVVEEHMRRATTTLHRLLKPPEPDQR